MTWYYDATGTSIDIYDHTGALVAESVEFSGSWSDVPDVVFETMQSESTAEYQANGFSGDLLLILRDAIFENIEQGPPP